MIVRGQELNTEGQNSCYILWSAHVLLYALTPSSYLVYVVSTCCAVVLFYAASTPGIVIVNTR